MFINIQTPFEIQKFNILSLQIKFTVNFFKHKTIFSLILYTICYILLLNMANCPYCEQVIDLGQLKTEEFEDGDLLFKFLGLSCPKCEKLLKIQKID